MPSVRVRRERTPHLFINTGLPLPIPRHRSAGSGPAEGSFAIAIVIVATIALVGVGWALGVGYRAGSFHPLNWAKDVVFNVLKALRVF